MIPLDLVTGFRPNAEGPRVPVAEGPREVIAVNSVQQVLAKVEQQLADGRYRVLAGAQRFDVELPAWTRAGDMVKITLPATTSGASSAEHTPPSARSELSSAGRLVAQLAAQLLDPRTPGTIPATQPLLPNAPVDTELAAATLRELVGLSGLFYESHQAEWVSGERDAQQLRREPQGQFDPAQVERRSATGVHTTLADPSSAEAPFGRPLELHPGAAPLVQQQINALEARHIAWLGEVWQGQQMRWEIKDAEERAPDSAEPAHVWRTRVVLNLPRLGAVTALFTLGAGGIGLRLHAESQSTNELIAQRLPELRGALGAAGLDITEIGRDARAGI